MNKEQLFWMAIIIVLNIAAYLVGRHDGKKKGYDTMLMVFKAVAPNETDAIIEKVNRIDPFRFAKECAERKEQQR